MATSDEQIRIDVRQALADIAQLKGGLADLRGEATKTRSATENAFGAESALKEAQAVDALRKKYAEIRQAADTLRTALKSAYDPRAIQVYSDALAKVDVAQKKIEVGAKAVGVSLKDVGKEGSLAAQVVEDAFGKLSKASIIISLIEGVYELAKAGLELSVQYDKAKIAFTAFLGSADKADQVLGSLLDTAQKKFLNTDDVLKAGQSLLAFGESAANLPDVLGRIADISAATGKNFNELTVIYGKARTAGVLYAEDINQLVDAGIPIIQEFAKQLGVSESQVKKLASQGKISFEELQLAFFNLTKEGDVFFDHAGVQAETLPGKFQALKNRLQPILKDIGGFFNQLGKDLVGLGDDILDALGVADKATKKGAIVTQEGLIELQKLRDKALQAVQIDNSVANRGKFDELNDALLEAGRIFYEKQKDQREDAQILEDQAAKARNKKVELTDKELKALRDKKLKEEAEYNKELLKLSLERLDPKSEELEIAKENVRFEAQKKEFKKFGLDTEDIERIHQANLFMIRLDFENKRVKQEQESAKRLADIYDKANKDFEDKKKKQFDAAKDEIDFQKEIADRRIDVQEELNKGIIISLQKSGAKEAVIKEAQRQFDLQIQKAALEADLKYQEAQLDLLNKQGGDNTKQADQILAKIDKIKTAIANVTADTAANPAKKGKHKSFLQTLFPDYSEDDIKKLQDNINTVKDSIISTLQEVVRARIDAADKELDLAKKKTEAAQAEFDKQKSLDEQGFADSRDSAEKALILAQDNEAKAQKMKEDAQKKQLQLDNAIQLSSLVTAAANTFKGFSEIPLVGQILAVASIAAMFAAFAVARKKAAAAIKFRDGGEGRVDSNGVIVGQSHAHGGVGFEAEGGEFFHTDGRQFGIVNKRSTAANFDLLAAINRNDEGAKNRWALNRVATMNRDGINAAIGEGRGSVTVIAKEDKKAHKLLGQIRDKKQADQIQTWEENGFRVVVRGGHTTRTKLRSR